MLVFFERNPVFCRGPCKSTFTEKKIRAGVRVQQERGGVNVLPDNVLRSERANACCTRVAMQRQSVGRTVRFSRAPCRFFRPRRYRIATRKKILASAHLARSGSIMCDKTDARCRNDVRTFLHFWESKSLFSSRETCVCGSSNVRMFLQRKKFKRCAQGTEHLTRKYVCVVRGCAWLVR